MSARRSPFVQVARDPFGAWLTLDSDTRMLGPALALRFGNDAVLEGVTLKELPDLLCRDLAIDAKKRPAFRQRLAKLIACRLLIDTEDGVKLLWSREAYLAHRPKRPVAEPLAAPVAEPLAAHPTSEPSVSHESPIGQPSVTHPKLTIENHSTQPAHKERKKERIKRTPPTGAPAPVVRPMRSTRPKDEKLETLNRVLAEAGREHRFLSVGLLSRKNADVVVRKAAALAERDGIALEAAVRQNVLGAWQRHQATGKELKWCLVDWQPGQPVAAPSRGRYVEPAMPSPPESFNVPGLYERQLAKIRARRVAEAQQVAG